MNEHKRNVIFDEQNPAFQPKTRIASRKCTGIVKTVTMLFVAIQNKKKHGAQEIICWMCMSDEIVNSKWVHSSINGL
jgi:hypothetical protein